MLVGRCPGGGEGQSTGGGGRCGALAGGSACALGHLVSHLKKRGKPGSPALGTRKFWGVKNLAFRGSPGGSAV